MRFLGFFGMIGIIGIFGILIAGCTPPQPPEDVTDLLGPYTATGTVTATGASLHRRGTHLLLMEGKPRFFLESKQVSLQEYQDALVVVEGELSLNTHKKYLPVIDVHTIQHAAEPTAAETQRFEVATLKLSLEAPPAWESELEGRRLTFAYSDEEGPFIAIEEVSLIALPDGIPLRIDGRNGVRVVEEGSAVHQVFVDRTDSVLLFTFGPKGDKSMREREAFYTMLRSVEFEGDEGDEGGEGGEGTGSLQPCGGPAGVICPEGEYCAITEIQTGIGVCRSLE